MGQNSIMTLDDLRKAKVENPALVHDLLSRVGVVKDLEDYLWRKSASELQTTVLTKLKRVKQRSRGIHPSSACKKGVCLKKVFYDCVEELVSNSEYNRNYELTWDIGTFLHELHQAYFTDMFGSQFRAEVPISKPELLLKSSTDGIFDCSNYRSVLEMKSIKEGGNYGWEKIQAKPFEDNVRQAHFYMWMLDIPFGNILYICKNTSDYKEHAFAFDDVIWDDIVNNVINPVVAAVNGGPMVEAKPGWGCKMCGYKHGCPDSKRSSNDARSIESWPTYS
jgi:hypothetical protein